MNAHSTQSNPDRTQPNTDVTSPSTISDSFPNQTNISNHLSPLDTNTITSGTITPPPLAVQKRQTRRWLAAFFAISHAILLMAIGWLGYKFSGLQKQLTEQKQINQTLTSQIHDIDDKLVKLSTPMAEIAAAEVDKTTTATTNGQNQLDVLKVQLQTADMLLAKADYPAVKNLLDTISYQLNQPNSGITPAMRLTLSNSLQQDQQLITKLQSQPTVWQTQSMALVEIQKFLQEKHADYQQVLVKKSAPSNTPLTYAQAQLFEMLTTLNFALQASQNQQSDLYISYASQLKQQANNLADSEKTNEGKLLSPTDSMQLQEMINKLNNQLPVSPRLQTGQILQNQIPPATPTTYANTPVVVEKSTSATSPTAKKQP